MRQPDPCLGRIAALLLATASLPAVASVPDQCVEHTYTTATNGQRYEQQIRAGESGQLEGLTFYFFDACKKSYSENPKAHWLNSLLQWRADPNKQVSVD